MAVTVEQGEQECRVRLEGEINIGVAAELKKVLIEALQADKAVRIACEGATCMDVTGLQLLWAAEREAQRAGLRFACAGGMPPAIAAAVVEAGLEFPMTASEPGATA